MNLLIPLIRVDDAHLCYLLVESPLINYVIHVCELIGSVYIRLYHTCDV